MSLISLARVKWHECVVDLLGRSDAIADRDSDGRAIYYLFGWSGTLEFTNSRGAAVAVESGLGSVRMDGFCLFTKAQLAEGQVVLAEIHTPKGPVHRIFARVTNSSPAARYGKAIDCVIIDEPEFAGDEFVRLSITQEYD